jgi:hypothetical protein
MTKLYLLNFILLQWFCIRLARKMVKRDSVFTEFKDEYTQIGWGIIFVVPLTGWWSDYIWIWKKE